MAVSKDVGRTPEGKYHFKGDHMDENKRKKIIMLIILTFISLAVAIVACVLGISPEQLKEYMPSSGIELEQIAE